MKIKDYDFLVGTYEWYHAVNVNNESESIETTEERYALKFKKNGSICIYHNGELVGKGEVRDVYNYTHNELVRVSCRLFDKGHSFHFHEDVLESDTYPNSDFTHKFRKL